MAALAVAPGTAWAVPCGTWGYGVSVDPNSAKGSKVLDVSWTDNGPPPCSNAGADDWDGTHHTVIRRVEGSSSTMTPSDGVAVHYPSTGYGTFQDFVGRSGKIYSYAMFACEDAGCTSWYGDGSGGAGEQEEDWTDIEATEQEIWEITGITGETDFDHGVVLDYHAQAPFGWIYPAGWAAGYSGRVAIYYSIDASNSNSGKSEVRYKRYSDTGWPEETFNDGGWDTGVLVGQGSNDTAEPAEDFQATYAWSMRVRDGSDKRIILWLRTRYMDGGVDKPEQIISVWSDDESGSDFGLDCDATDCDYSFSDASRFQVDIEPGVTAGSEHLASVREGQSVWDYVLDAIFDVGTDDPPPMWVNVEDTGAGCLDAGEHERVTRANAIWDTSNFDWSVEVEEDPPYCAMVGIADYRISTLFPLPNGELKAYVQAWDMSGYKVIYWNGYAWEDEADFNWHWDGSPTSGPDQHCIEGPSVVPHLYPGGVDEGMFMRVLDSDVGPCTAVSNGGLDDTTIGFSAEESRIVFARLTNG